MFIWHTRVQWFQVKAFGFFNHLSKEIKKDMIYYLKALVGSS